MSPWSLTTRLSLLFALSMAAVLFVLGHTLERAVDRHFYDMDRTDLAGKLALVREIAADHTRGDRRWQPLDAALVAHPDLIIRIWATTGEVAFAHGELPVGEGATGLEVFEQPLATERWIEWSHDGRPFRGLLAPLSARDAGTRPGRVLIGLDIHHHQVFLKDFRWTLALSILTAATVAAMLGWVAVRTGLRPLRRITVLAADLNTERLDTRLPENGVPVEIRALVVAFNGMLQRLEDSFRRISDFSADVAHELRTPIANLTLQTQVALGGERDAAAYREVLYSSLEEYERLGRMIGDMLYLARADHGLLRPVAANVDLGEQVRALFDYFDAWAEERGVCLCLDGEARVRGDPAMLRRALSNLLSNAIRHTDSGAAVHVRLRENAGRVEVSIENPGPELPRERLERLFERFYRVESDTTASAEPPGAGLGLAIVKAIVTAHGGQVSASATADGVRFIIALPRSAGLGERAAPSV